MSDNWNFYKQPISENEIAYVRLNLDLINKPPIKDYIHLVKVLMRMKPSIISKKPKINIKTMGIIEEEYYENFPLNIPHKFTCVFTTPFTKSMYFYMQDTSQFKKAWETILSKHKNIIYKFKEEDDQEWVRYKSLYPNEFGILFMDNNTLINALIKNGDNLNKPRSLKHWTLFKTQSDAEKFSKIIESIGYKLICIDKVLKDDIYKVQFERTDIIGNVDVISKITFDLLKIAKEFYGKYDGWESPITK